MINLIINIEQSLIETINSLADTIFKFQDKNQQKVLDTLVSNINYLIKTETIDC